MSDYGEIWVLSELRLPWLIVAFAVFAIGVTYISPTDSVLRQYFTAESMALFAALVAVYGAGRADDADKRLNNLIEQIRRGERP